MFESNDLKKIIQKLSDFVSLYTVVDILLDYIEIYSDDERYSASDIFEKIILQLMSIIEEQKKRG